ncbi:unnamed protein product [Mytilus coruscus]|uniref:Uncharacterized protein n=1 Tax=Mytilus coruscus TaxID=42192 RepID=A0A6J8D8Y8_MYTCO|nr:unnamed protein product [Mytilus coruscus]
MKFKGNLACVIFGTTVLLLVIFFFKHLHTLTYLHKRYIRKVDFSPNVRKLENIPIIPQHIHQMYFDVNGMDHLNQYEFARKSWLKCCSGCRYTLWNESMVDNFVKEQYPSLFNLYSNYQQWVLKIDLGKYAIVHYFGGIYADIDLECTKNITSLLLRIHSQRKQVLLHRGDFGTFTNDFSQEQPNIRYLNSYCLVYLMLIDRTYFRISIPCSPLVQRISMAVSGTSDIRER